MFFRVMYVLCELVVIELLFIFFLGFRFILAFVHYATVFTPSCFRIRKNTEVWIGVAREAGGSIIRLGFECSVCDV